LEDRFLWLDWVEDTAPLLAAMDLFVSASHTESFGLAILEAMATGNAVYPNETAGAKELLRDDGVFVGINDPVALAERICEMLGDEEKRKNFGIKCQKIAGERFSLDRMIDETEKLYKAVLHL